MDTTKTQAVLKHIRVDGGKMRWKLFYANGDIIRYSPTWGTENGAKRWAVRNGYELTFAQPSAPIESKTAVIVRQKDEQLPYVLLMSGREYEFPNPTAAIQYAKSLSPAIEIIDNTPKR